MKEPIIHCDWFKEHLRGKSSQAIKQRNVETIIESDVNCLMSNICKFVRVISLTEIICITIGQKYIC